MFYTKEYIFEKLNNKLSNLKISSTKKNNIIIYTIEYKGFKVNIDIDKFLARLDYKQSKKSDILISEFVFNIENNFLAQENFANNNFSKEYFLKNVYPILRNTTFGKTSKEKFITKLHTNETKIFYSLDLGNSYKIITKDMLDNFSLTDKDLDKYSLINLKKLPLKYNVDKVAGNTFYFLNSKDGYDGSRLLDENVLEYFYKKINQPFYLGIPNQDSLVIADIKNKKGLEILQKIMVHFFSDGRVPITTITFKYDNKKLESLFIFVE